MFHSLGSISFDILSLVATEMSDVTDGINLDIIEYGVKVFRDAKNCKLQNIQARRLDGLVMISKRRKTNALPLTFRARATSAITAAVEPLVRCKGSTLIGALDY